MNEYVQGKVGPPGIALTIFGLVCVATNLLSGIYFLATSLSTIMSLVNSGADVGAWIAFLTSTGIWILMSLAAFFVSFVVTFGGLRLRSVRSAGLVYTGAVLAMIPCCVGWCCCWFGIPIGIWVIMTMQDEQVKAAFAEQF
jgi:hypothetical protein